MQAPSVLIVGCSGRQGGVPVALLGGGMGRNEFRLCDFGGGLDGGPSRHGGARHASAERSRPELGAFRELAEELFGLHGDDARDLAATLWQKAANELVGARPIPHKRHLVYVCTAESLITSMEEHPASPSLPSLESAIDRLAARFEPNSEVCCVALVAIKELLTGIQKADVALAVPIWGCYGRHGGVHPYTLDACTELERIRNVPSATLCIEVVNRRGRLMRLEVNPSSLEQKDGDRSLKVFRWESVNLRYSGSTCSIATLAAVLSTWAAALYQT